MSLKFSDTTNKDGIIQRIEDELGFSDGYITGDSTMMAKFTANVNLAHDDALRLIFSAGGTWQFDDSNHDDYPIITTNLVSGQRDYTFTVDDSGNLILDIYKVQIKTPDGKFIDIYPVDQQTRNNNNSDTTTLTDGQNLTGTPTRYDKTANGFFLDLIPSYNSTAGLKVFINREGSYFNTGSTSTKPGISGLFHEYYVVNPAYRYASSKRLDSKDDLLARKTAIEVAMTDHYGKRERDIDRRMNPNVENSK